MKKRAFFTTLCLFLLFFNAAIFLISTVMLKDSLRIQKERCLVEHYIIASSLIKDIQAAESRNLRMEEVISELMIPYTYFSQNNQLGLAVYREEEPIFSNMANRKDAQPLSDSIAALLMENRTLTVRNSVLSIVGRLPAPYQAYALAYQYDIGDTLLSWRQMKNTLYLAGSVFSAVLAFCLLLLLGRVFRPLVQVSEASQAIVAGDYKKRLPVFGRDELSDLSQNFNRMVDEIESQMAALRDAAEQKQRFIDSFAHELRTPLTTIYGYAEYIRKAAITEEDKLAATGYILSECKRMEKMAVQLLDLALLRDGEAEQEQIAVSSLFQTTRAIMYHKAAEKAVRIFYQADWAFFTGNRDLLQILLVNLIDNAMKACVEGGTIVVKAYLEAESPVLCVVDNGKGMSEEVLSRLTEAFYRADKARSRTNGGAGLGLSICDQIAQIHHARLCFSSAPGQGCEAKLVFLQVDDGSVITPSSSGGIL